MPEVTSSLRSSSFRHRRSGEAAIVRLVPARRQLSKICEG